MHTNRQKINKSRKRVFFRRPPFLVVIAILFSLCVQAQNVITMATQVIPPYSPYLSDYTSYNNRLVLLLSNNVTNATQEVRLVGELTGNNGVNLSIPLSYIPPQPITILPRQTLRLTGNQLRDYINENAFQLAGITREELTIGNGLPEGNYQLCLRAVDYRTGRFLSMPEPMGCAYFTVTHLEPPFVVQPACGEMIARTMPQNIFFSWSVPAGANPADIEYVLKVAEMYPPDIDPNQAMLAGTNPPLFEKVVYTNTYLYGLADPFLEQGKKYAFRVTAQPRGGVNARIPGRNVPNFRNNGHSEVCTFTFGEAPGPVDTEQENIIEEKDAPILIDQEPVIVRDQKDGSPFSPQPDVLTGNQNIPDYVVFVNSDLLSPPLPPPNDGEGEPAPNDEPECVSNTCEVSMPANNNLIAANAISPGQTVAVGKFIMTLQTIASAGSGFNGTGTILLNFLNTPVNVEFEDLQINTDFQAFGANSKITAVIDGALPANHPALDQQLSEDGITEEQLADVNSFNQQAGRKVSQFPANNQQPIGVPFSLDNGNLDLNIVGLIFTPTTAYMNAVAGFELPQGTGANEWLKFTTSVCIRPNGFGEEGEISLAGDVEVPISDKVYFNYHHFSHVTFDCSGINNIHLEGELVFDRDLLLPLDNDGEVIPGTTQVAAAFATDVSDFHDWTLELLQLSHPFTIPALIGFQMEAADIVLDQSETTSPANAGQLSSWQGLYIGTLAVTLPDFFRKDENPVNFGVNHFSLDKFGFSGTIDPGQGLISINEGQIGSWPISVTDFSIEIANSGLEGASIGGALRLPISSTELEYDLTLQAPENPGEIVDFQFSIQETEELEVDMWFALLNLEETSTISVEKDGNTYIPSAMLTGDVTFGWTEESGPAQNNMVSSFDIPTIAFEELSITDDDQGMPDVNFNLIELDTDNPIQGSLAGFTLSMDPPAFVKNGNELGIQFNLDLVLNESANGITGGTTFTIFGEYGDGHFGYSNTQLNEISLGVDVGVAELNGEITIYQQDEVFGNGFRGQIEIVINPVSIGVDATLQVGNVNNFRYWYFDIMADLSGIGGINIPGTMASIYGIGGGAYYNMSREETPVQTIDDLNDVSAYDPSPGANKDGLQFVPEQGTFGFSAAVAFGLTGPSSVFNGDLKFSMELQASGAVNHVTLEGGCYMMQEITDRSSALISGTLYSEIQPRIPNASDEENLLQNRPNFQLNAALGINIANGMITGNGTLDIWFSPNEWWIKLGEWTNQDYPWEDEARTQISVDIKVLKVDFHSYFMVGSNIPDMPLMPLQVREAFQDDPAQNLNPGPRIGVLTTNNPDAISGSPGMAFGAGKYFGTDIEFLVFYASVDFINGFDVVLKKYEVSPCGGTIGVNNWFAKGQMYAYLDFDVGIQLDIWVWEGKFSFLKAIAAATLQAALPNPTWIKGQFKIEGEVLEGIIKINTQFRFELGEKCEDGGQGPFGEFPIVSDVIPENGGEDVHVHTTPEIAFNFPQGIFTYTEENDEGELEERSYRYQFVTFKYEYTDPQTNDFVTLDMKPHMNYRPDGYSATFYHQERLLPEETLITYTIYVQGWRVSPDGPTKVYDETNTGTFTTGKWPSQIEAEKVAGGSPAYKQNFFLKSEHPSGYLEMTHNYAYLDDAEWWYEDAWELGNNYNNFNAGSFNFLARFIELETNQTYSVPFQANGAKITFPIPQQLKNNTIYELKLVVVYTPPVNSFAMQPGGGGNTQETYQDVLVTGQQGGGGIGAFQNMVFAPQIPNNPDSNPGLANQNLTQAVVQPNGGNVPFQNNQTNMEFLQENANNNAQILQNNFMALAAVEPEIGDFKNPTDDGPVVFNPNGIFDQSMQLATNPGSGTYIQRRHRELLEAKKGEGNFEWPILQNFGYYFKTSRFNTLQAKLNSMEVDEVIHHDYTGEYDKFNDGDALHEPEFSEGSKIAITTTVPVVLLEIEENFEYLYDISGYKKCPSDNDCITVPPLVKVMEDEEAWYTNEFLGSASNIYHLPDADDWAQFPYYSDEDGMFIGYYAQVLGDIKPFAFPFPGEYWGNFVPDPGDDDPWAPDRFSGGNNAKPFGNQDFFNHYEAKSGGYFPLQVFYKNAYTHGNINFGGKYVVWFKNTLLGSDDIVNAKEKGQEEDTPGGGFQDGFGFQSQGGNTGGVNPAFDPEVDIMSESNATYLAVIDYAEWVAMRDYYLLRKFMYQRNEEEEGTFFDECHEGDKNLPGMLGANCFYGAMKNYINNIMWYGSLARPGGHYIFRFGSEDSHRDFEFEIPNKLNDD